MSLKDLLPEGSYDEIVAEAHTDEQALKQESSIRSLQPVSSLLLGALQVN